MTFKGWLLVILNIVLVFGGLFLIIGSEYSENPKTGQFLNVVGVVFLIGFALFWAIKFATDERGK